MGRPKDEEATFNLPIATVNAIIERQKAVLWMYVLATMTIEGIDVWTLEEALHSESLFPSASTQPPFHKLPN